MKEKFCPRCRTNKPVNQFWKRIITADGYCPYCKTCMDKYYNGHHSLHGLTAEDIYKIEKRILQGGRIPYETSTSTYLFSRFVATDSFIRKVEKQSIPRPADEQYKFEPFVVPQKINETPMHRITIRSNA